MGGVPQQKSRRVWQCGGALRVSEIDWTNAAGGRFTDSANWSGGIVPGAKDTAVIGDIAFPSTEVLFNGNKRLGALDISNGELILQTGTLTVSGGALGGGGNLAQIVLDSVNENRGTGVIFPFCSRRATLWVWLASLVSSLPDARTT